MKARHAIASLLLALAADCAAGTGDVRDTLRAALELRDEALRSIGREPASSDAIRVAIGAADPEQWEQLTPYLPPAPELQDRIARARAALLASAVPVAPRAPGAKAIDYPEPDPISDCVDASAAATQGLLEAWSAATEVLAAAKWACLQTTLGANGSEACTALAVAAELIEGDLDRQSFCLGAQRDAVLAAFSQTQSNVVDFINERADATASSRATQLSVDALRTTLDSVLLRLTALRATLVEDDTAVAQGLGDILDDAMGVAAQLTALSADVADVRFRIQAVQVDVEDAQQRLADVQSIADRLAGDSLHLRTTLASIQSRLAAAQSALQSAADAQRDRRLAAALGDPRRVILRYRLPAASGGELERSRELLIRTITAFQSLGADTSAARALLVSGDDAYNQGRPLDAYDAFARAYRALLDTQTSLSVLIMRNSFE
jgi:hypothetical protein